MEEHVERSAHDRQHHLPVLFGIALGDLLYGLPIDSNGEFTGSFWSLLTPYGIWVGITLLSLTLLHGSTFLALRTTGIVHDRARKLTMPFALVAIVTVVVFTIWTQVLSDHGDIPGPLQAIPVIAVVAAAWAVRDRHDGWAFTATAIAIALTIVSIFVDLYPNVMVSSTSEANNLTVSSAASGNYALKIMTIVAVVIFPIVLAYQLWNFHVFRQRIASPPAPSPTPQAAQETT